MIELGTKVKYLYEGKWQKGIVHGVKTHEEPSGIITRVAYLIDTGRENPDHRGRPDKQPEQVEVDQSFVKSDG